MDATQSAVRPDDAEADLFPLTCEWCERAPATHLSVSDVNPQGSRSASRSEHMICAPCAHQVTILPPSFVGWWLYRLVPDNCGEA